MRLLKGADEAWLQMHQVTRQNRIQQQRVHKSSLNVELCAIVAKLTVLFAASSVSCFYLMCDVPKHRHPLTHPSVAIGLGHV